MGVTPKNTSCVHMHGTAVSGEVGIKASRDPKEIAGGTVTQTNDTFSSQYLTASFSRMRHLS